MVKTKGLILLLIAITTGLVGCGDFTRGYAIFRSRDIVIAFVPIRDTSEIADVKVDNKVLHVDIDTGEKIEKRVIRFEGRLLDFVEPHGILEIHGRNRINDYAVIHLRVTHPEHKAPKFDQMLSYKFYSSFRTTNTTKKIEPFENSGAFRFEDKIIAYSVSQDNIDSHSEGFKINIGPVELKHTPGSTNTHMITFGEIGERLLILKKYKIDSDKTVRDLHFLLKDLAPDETAKIKEVKNLGDRIVIAELAVAPLEH
ncbi:MAG: hypothetical protein OYL97_05650 [Candidatus Poribacteria bacterium]|nr:hypothetical protein [Candidatus Poribacteria bacterium]